MVEMALMAWLTCPDQPSSLVTFFPSRIIASIAVTRLATSMIRPRASSATAVVFDDKLIGTETSESTYVDSRGIHERNPTFREFIQVKVVDSNALLGNVSQLVVL